MGLGDRVRKLDMFKKVPTDLTEGTNVGGAISLITLFASFYFLYFETISFLQPSTKTTLGIDSPITYNEVTIHLDIVFPRFPCELISLDLQDIMMAHSVNLGSVEKFRLDYKGQRMEAENFEILRERNIARQLEMAREAIKNHFGCHLKGSFTVKEVPGNFHISSHAYQNLYMQLMMEGFLQNIDVAHEIKHFSFGSKQKNNRLVQRLPEALVAPLNGVSQNFTSNAPHHTSHYHIDVVPTIYHGSFGQASTAYQFTYNHFAYPVPGMPSIYFNYHMGGLTVHVGEQPTFLLHFLMRICAIIGGIYALASFLHHALSKQNQYAPILN